MGQKIHFEIARAIFTLEKVSPESQLLNSLKRESRKISSVPKLTTFDSAVHAANKDNKKTIFAAGAALEIGGEIDGVLKNKNNVLLRRAWCLAQLNEFGPAQMDLDMIEVKDNYD